MFFLRYLLVYGLFNKVLIKLICWKKIIKKMNELLYCDMIIENGLR